MNNRHLLTINHHIPALLVLLLLFIAGFTAISDAFPLNPSLTAPTYHHDPEITPSFNDFRIYTHNRSTTYDPQSTDRTRAPPAVRTELHQLNLEYYHDDAEGSTVAPKRGDMVGSIPKPPRGKGAVPPSQRDPKRNFTKKQKAEKLQEEGGKCVGCESDLDISDAKGHHRERHADGGQTIPENLDVLCPDCHKKLHSP